MKYLQYFHIPEEFCLIFHTHRTMKKIYCLWMIFLQTSYSISQFFFLSQFKKRLKIHIRDTFMNSWLYKAVVGKYFLKQILTFFCRMIWKQNGLVL